MGSCMEEPSTLDNTGTESGRARLGSCGGVGLEKIWSDTSVYKFLFDNLEEIHANLACPI